MAKPPARVDIHRNYFRTMPVRSYATRVVDSELDALLGPIRAISIEGAKGVGKTETARKRASSIYELDDPEVRAILNADPARAVSAEGVTLIDEWQELPQTWDLVRRKVDRPGSKGLFLLTGSASPPTPSTHSGAGRIIRIHMRPMTLVERGVGSPSVSLAQLLKGKPSQLKGQTAVDLEQYVHEIVQSGYPGMRSLTGRALRAQLDGYLSRVVDRDVEGVGAPIRKPESLRRWLEAYAAAVSTTTSLEKIRDAASSVQGELPSKEAAARYRDVLERIWVLEPMAAWLPTHNHLSRLTQAPKHYLVDPALAARLLGIDADALLASPSSGRRAGHDTMRLGQLFEALAALQLRVFAQSAECRVLHLRTRAGDHEVDFIVERSDHRVLAVEVKLTQDPTDHDVRHLNWLEEKIGTDLLDKVVLTSGRHAYRRSDGVAVVPLALLGP